MRKWTMLLNFLFVSMSFIFLPISSSPLCLTPSCRRMIMRDGVMVGLAPIRWQDHALGNCSTDGSAICDIQCVVTVQASEIVVASITKVSGERSLYYGYLSSDVTPLNITYLEIPNTLDADEVDFDHINWLVYWTHLSAISTNSSLRRSDLFGNTEVLLESPARLIFGLDAIGRCLFYSPVYDSGDDAIRGSMNMGDQRGPCSNSLDLHNLRSPWFKLFVNAKERVLYSFGRYHIELSELDNPPERAGVYSTITLYYSTTVAVNILDRRLYLAVGRVTPEIFSSSYGGGSIEQVIKFDGRRYAEFMQIHGIFLYVAVNVNDVTGELYMIDTQTNRIISMAYSLVGRYGQIELGDRMKFNIIEIN